MFVRSFRMRIVYGKEGKRQNYSQQDSSIAHLSSSSFLSAVVQFPLVLISLKTKFPWTSLLIVYFPSGVLYHDVAFFISFTCISFSSEVVSISVSWGMFCSHFSQKIPHSIGTTSSATFHSVFIVIWKAIGSGLPQPDNQADSAKLMIDCVNFIIKWVNNILIILTIFIFCQNLFYTFFSLYSRSVHRQSA